MRKKIILIIVMLVVLASIVLFVDPVYYWIANNVGRWHIIILHFPIGLIACAWLMELLVRMGKFNLEQSSVRFVLFMGAASAVFAAISGLILKNQGGYEPELVSWHQWLGIAATLVALIVFWLSFTEKKTLYFSAFTIQVFLLIIAGHYGGSLTHGEGFLTENLTNTQPMNAELGEYVAYDEAKVWDDVIQPIFESKCISCHNPSKKKGGLVLTDSLSIMKGGKRGSIFDPNSEVNLCKVLDLALEEELHMPPKGKLQVTTDERAILCWWANSEVPFSKKVSESSITPEIEKMLKERFTPKDPIDLLGIEIPDANLIAQLKEDGARIQSEGPESSWIAINFSDKPKLKVADLEVLNDLQPNITQLDLGNSKLDADIIDWIIDCEQLKVLKLDQCKVTKEYLETLSEMQYLQELNLYRAKIDSNVDKLFGEFKSLKKLFLWNSSLSEKTIKKIRSLNRKVDVISDDPGRGFPKQKIAAPHFTIEEIFLSKGDAIPLANVFPTAKIYFTSDGTEPTNQSNLLTEKSTFKKTSQIKARAYLKGWEPSDIVTATFIESKLKPFSVKRKTTPEEDYKGASSNGLNDGKLGEALISDEQWVGYFGKDFQVTIDLKNVQSVNGVAFHCLEDVKSWVMFPSYVTIEAGESIGQLKVVSEKQLELSNGLRGALMDAIHVESSCEAQFLRVTIKSFGKLPEWHSNPGEPSWLFIDELMVY